MFNFKNTLIFLLGVSIAAFFWGVVIFFLQKTPIFYIPIKKEYSFYPINLTHLFFNNYQTKESLPLYTLKGIKLKGLYYNGKTGFIIVEKKSKTIFIDLNKKYNGYKLIKIGINYAIFEKDNKKYKISLNEKKQNFQTINSPVITVSKKTFKEYKNNLTKIWQNIGIVKTQKGYKITFIKKDSIFDKLGLKKGDILIEVNKRQLKNDADAWDLYNNADKFQNFEIKLIRNNKIKVIYYEMD